MNITISPNTIHAALVLASVVLTAVVAYSTDMGGTTGAAIGSIASGLLLILKPYLGKTPTPAPTPNPLDPETAS